MEARLRTFSNWEREREAMHGQDRETTMPGRVTSGYVQAEKGGQAPEVMIRVEMLEKQVEQMRDSAARLRERLGPVLRPEQPCPMAGALNTPTSLVSPLAAQLGRIGESAAGVGADLRSLLAGLEI